MKQTSSCNKIYVCSNLSTLYIYLLIMAYDYLEKRGSSVPLHCNGCPPL